MKSFFSFLFDEDKPVGKTAKAISEVVVIFFGATGLFLLLINIFSRYFLGIGLYWAEEYGRYCFILIIYFGLPLTIRANQMLKVDILASIFPKLQNFEDWVEIISGLFVSTICFVLGFQFTKMMHMFAEKSSTILWLPMWVIYAIMPVGMVFIFYAYAQRGYNQIMKKKAGKEDAA
ncbi:MAG: TRAP transporter small permease [Ruminococcaceae bacterium]|nr:TRAP transporter small permease [Oscillospiraceae bacterium]